MKAEVLCYPGRSRKSSAGADAMNHIIANGIYSEPGSVSAGSVPA